MSGKAIGDNPSINFFPGHPSSRLLPRAQVLAATSNVLFPQPEAAINAQTYKDPLQRDPLNYATDEGPLWVREVVAKWINDKFNLISEAALFADHINLTAGASYGVLNILLQTTLAATGYTRQAFIVTPCYYLINDCFIDAGFKGKITAVDETQDHQLDFVTIEAKLIELERKAAQEHNSDSQLITTHPRTKKIYRYVFWCVPSFANPSGGTFSLETRLKLIEIARKYDMLIICDDVYDFLHYTENFPPPRLDMLDRQSISDSSSYGNTVSNASFSKIIAPGLRVGWQATATSKLAYQLSQGGANTSGGTPAHFSCTIAGNMILSGEIDKIIDGLRSVYSERALALKSTFDRCFPKSATLSGGDGGYFFWLTFPPTIDCHTVCKAAKTHGVNLANGDFFEVYGDSRNWGKSSVRLSVSFLEKEELVKGMEIVGEICSQLMGTTTNSN